MANLRKHMSIKQAKEDLEVSLEQEEETKMSRHKSSYKELMDAHRQTFIEMEQKMFSQQLTAREKESARERASPSMSYVQSSIGNTARR